MRQMIIPGVNLYLEPTKKFKTIMIDIKFRTAYDPEQATKRTLLKNIMVTNTKKYPTQRDMDLEMARLYGASLSSNSQRYGKQHVVSFSLQIVNDRYISGQNRLMEDSVAFLQQILWEPNAENRSFHLPTFEREKDNLKNYFESLQEDKAGYARRQLNQILFKGTDLAYLGIGDERFLDAVTPEDLYQEYLRMLQEDAVDILISGDTVQERIEPLFKSFHFSPRPDILTDVYVRPQFPDYVQVGSERQDIQQGKLYFGFSAPVYYMREHYFAGIIFNGLFGGFPHSKLFQNVREKESLAYTASSNLDTIAGILTVGTGIEFSKAEKTEEIVMKQLAAMKDGDFEDQLIQQTKDMLMNQFRQNDDSQTRSLARVYQDHLFLERPVGMEELLEGIGKVKREEIVAVAQDIELKAIFFLKGVTE